MKLFVCPEIKYITLSLVMTQSKFVKLLGYHGTSRRHARSILDSTYIISPSPEDWLGTGIYFFVDGISCPQKNAREWAVNKFGRDDAAVVESVIVAPVEKLLDLTTIAGMSIYNDNRISYLESNRGALMTRRDLKVKKRRDVRLDDRLVTDALREKISISILIHNVYIKNELQRALIMESSYPNATVCSVSNLSLIQRTRLID